jgi:hypothetical protein
VFRSREQVYSILVLFRMQGDGTAVSSKEVIAVSARSFHTLIAYTRNSVWRPRDPFHAALGISRGNAVHSFPMGATQPIPSRLLPPSPFEQSQSFGACAVSMDKNDESLEY